MLRTGRRNRHVGTFRFGYRDGPKVDEARAACRCVRLLVSPRSGRIMLGMVLKAVAQKRRNGKTVTPSGVSFVQYNADLRRPHVGRGAPSEKVLTWR
jgi:hypothetical protein